MNYKLFNAAVPVKDNNIVLVDGLVQFDTANIINVRLMDGVEPFDFTGYTQVFLEILKPDGTVIEACVGMDTDEELIIEENGYYTVNEEILNKANNPYTIQVLDPEEGLIRFALKDQATILPGTHFCQLLIMGTGERLTSARINYYVGDTMYEEAGDFVSTNEYSALVELYRQLARVVDEEMKRIAAEENRMSAENDRLNTFAELMEKCNELSDNLQEINQYKDLIRQMWDAVMNNSPSRDIMEEMLAEFDTVTQEELDALADTVGVKTRHFDAGEYTDSDDTVKHLQARRGLEADMPDLLEGEFAYSTDTQTAYIGGSSGPIALNGIYHAGSTAPIRRDLLWIDTSAGNVIKYFDGDAWVPTATNVFA